MVPSSGGGVVDLRSLACTPSGSHRSRRHVLSGRLISGFTVVLLSVSGLTAADAPGAGAVRALQDSLSKVSCPSSTMCMAVGKTRGLHGLIEHWNGAQWSAIKSRAPMASVSCLTSTSCVAAGATIRDLPRIKLWNGIKWKGVRISRTNGGNLLDGVSCVTGGLCVAVGDNIYVRQASELAIGAIRFPGVFQWTFAPATGAITFIFSTLSDVACPSSSVCMAVGSAKTTADQRETFVDELNVTNHTWSALPSPNPAEYNDLFSVSCTSASQCTAVGQSTPGSPVGTPLVETWDGATWTIVSTPSVPFGELLGVSCSTSTSCMAVGTGGSDLGGTALAEQWNGTAWTLVAPAGVLGVQYTNLYGVSCPSATDCVAVGEDSAAGGSTLVEHWNGSTWSVVPSPSP